MLIARFLIIRVSFIELRKIICKMANRRGSLPEFWQMAPEHGLEFIIERLTLRIEALEIENRTIKTQMNDMLRRMQRHQEGELHSRIAREITLPTFSGEIAENGNEFLREIEQYLLIKQIPDYYQPKIITNSLKGRAKVWFDAVKFRLSNFGEFSVAFRAEFMSEEMQERAKDFWRSNRYLSGSYLKYFYARIGEASKFDPPLSEYQRNKEIIKQFPNDIQIALASTELAQTEQVVRALMRIDETRSCAKSSYVNKGLDARYHESYNSEKQIARDQRPARYNNVYLGRESQNFRANDHFQQEYKSREQNSKQNEYNKNRASFIQNRYRQNMGGNERPKNDFTKNTSNNSLNKNKVGNINLQENLDSVSNSREVEADVHEQLSDYNGITELTSEN